MEAINWSSHDGQDFQLFCNALLSFEIGKSFQPFNAPGKDAGIDGFLDGAYDNKTGKWRFQYKFHGVARKQGFNQLKSDLKKEILNITDEDHFILITNVELLPQEVTELKDLYSSEIDSKKSASFEVWDGAKILSLSLQYPLLWLWLDEGFKTSQLQDFKEAFKNLLHVPLSEGYTLGNYFIARRDKIEDLKSFYNSKQSIALIQGEAGIGKTRLVLEFFKEIEADSGNPVCLVLMNKQIDFDKIKRALSGNNTTIILIDDAHEYSAEVISDITSLVNLLSPNVKLILTARTLQSYNSIRLLKEYEQDKILKIDLTELSRQDTIDLFKHELKDNYLNNYITELTTISFGKPILIVLILKAAFHNVPIADIKNNDFLINYVKNYFDSYYAKVVSETEMSKLQAIQLLQIVCLIEPINFLDKILVEKISKVLGTGSQSVGIGLNLLQSGNFVSGRYDSSIKPDYYSDILLKNVDYDVIKNAVIEFIKYLSNIITNLSSVDEVAKSENSALDEILDFYVSLMKDAEDIAAVNNVINTALTIAYSKPEVAIKVVNLFISGLQDEKSQIFTDYSEHRTYQFQSGESSFGRVRQLLSELLYRKENYEFVYNAIFKLDNIIDEPKFFSHVFQFAKRDFIEKFSFPRQTYFVSRFKKQFSKLPKKQLLFGIECLKAFLVHDFNTTIWDGESRNTISIVTYYIPNSASVKKFRMSVIKLLMEIFQQQTENDIKDEILFKLLDIPRAIFATTRDKTVYKGNAEIEAILIFVEEVVGSISPTGQKEVIDKLHWYKQWKIDSKFHPLLDKIKSLLVPKNFTEKILQIFAKSELAMGTWQKAEEESIKRCKLVIENSTVEEITDGLIDIYSNHLSRFYQFYFFLSIINNGYPAESQKIYSQLLEKKPDLIYQYGAAFLSPQYFTHKDENFYWEKVEQLQKLNNAEADNVILQVYAFKHPAYMDSSEKDLTTIETIIKKRNPKNNFGLSRALVVYVVKSAKKGVEYALQFLHTCNGREAENFFLFLYDDNVETIYDEIKTLCLQGTIRFDISYPIERCLNEIFKREESSIILEYLVKRFEYKRKSVISDKSILSYDFVPEGRHSHLMDGIEEHRKHELFESALEWFVDASFEPIDFIYVKDLLEYLKQTKFITDNLIAIFNKLTEKYHGEKNKIGRLLDGLAIFHDKDERLLSLILNIFETGYLLTDGDEEFLKELRYKAYAAITTVGVKSGTAGQPFPVDIALKDLLEKQITVTEEYLPTYKLLKDVLKSVDRDIQSSYDRDNETW